MDHPKLPTVLTAFKKTHQRLNVGDWVAASTAQSVTKAFMETKLDEVKEEGVDDAYSTAKTRDIIKEMVKNQFPLTFDKLKAYVCNLQAW